MIKVTAGQYARQFLTNQSVMIRDVAASFHHVHAQLQRRQRGQPQRQNVCALLWLRVTACRQRQYLLFRIGYQSITIHRNTIVCAEKTKITSLFSRSGNLGERNRFKRAFDERERIGVFHVIGNGI